MIEYMSIPARLGAIVRAYRLWLKCKQHAELTGSVVHQESAETAWKNLEIELENAGLFIDAGEI